MKRLPNLKLYLSFLFYVLVHSVNSHAAGLLQPANSQYQPLNITSHKVNVSIEDGYSTTEIEQVFSNPNSHQLEAVYSFPVPEHAVVGEFIYWINDKPIIAEAMAKDSAKQIYQQQKAQGRASALTEQDSYKHFNIQVYPVPAQQSVKIKLVYLQHSLLDHGIGRYHYPLQSGDTDQLASNFWHENAEVKKTFSFNVSIKSTYPITGVRLPSQPHTQVKKISDSNSHEIWQAQIQHPQHERDHTNFTLDQDIVVYWRLKSGTPGRLNWVAYRNPKISEKGTVKLTFTPGDDLTPISQGRDWVFVLDKSGSMQGKYHTLARGVQQGLKKLNANDRFKMIAFDENPYPIHTDFQHISDEAIAHAIGVLTELGTGGGTNLYEGLSAGLTNLNNDRPTGIVLVTDGVANVGNTAKKDFLALIQQQDIRLFTFIIGNSANHPLLQPMTLVSNGFATSVSNADDLLGHLLNIGSKLSHHAYRDISLTIQGKQITSLTPAQLGSLYRGEQLTIMGQYFEAGQADIQLTATVNGSKRTYRASIDLPEHAISRPELERLWALSKIVDLEQHMAYFEQGDSESSQAIQSLALEYGLLTDYTSLIVVEDTVYEQLGIERLNQQRVLSEQAARNNRENQSAVSGQQPLSTRSSASHSRSSGGGGSIGLGSLIILALLIWRRIR